MTEQEADPKTEQQAAGEAGLAPAPSESRVHFWALRLVPSVVLTTGISSWNPQSSPFTAGETEAELCLSLH